MPHERKRHLNELFKKLLGFSPIIGIFGHRQVGKSTYIAASVSEYRTLDDLDVLESAHRDPKRFIQAPHKTPLAIDECQLEPKLFPTLKEWVRTHKKPGQFVLSGSVRFTSRKVIRESLAGRIALIEMMPFTVTEIGQEPLSSIIVELLRHKSFSQDSIQCLHGAAKQTKLKKHFEIYLEQGGLPGICFIRSPELRKNALNDLHDLILTRDLQLVADVRTSLITMKRLLSYIAKQGFSAYSASEVKRLLGLAPATQKKILYAMESVFLIRRVPVPLRKKEIILLEDQLEEWTYSERATDRLKRLESAVYRNIRTQFSYRLDKNVLFESYLTRDHARVPLVIKHNEFTLGIIITLGEKPTLSETRSASSFLRHFSSAKLIYLSAESIEPSVLDERTILCSLYSIL